jgi:hypothetical protein
LLGLGAATGPARGPDDDFLALAHVAAPHFGRGSVAEPERQGERGRLAIGPDDPDAAGGAAANFAGGRRHLVVPHLLIVREELANARALGVADLLRLRPALGVGQTLKAPQLLAALWIVNRLELC